MADFGYAKQKTINVGGGLGARVFAVFVGILLFLFLLLNSITRVGSGEVGVLSLFGRVTGEILPEGIHVVNPFKTNNLLSVRTREIKESASVPSSEGLVMNLDTSLIYHLNAGKAAEIFPESGAKLSGRAG